MSNILRDKPHGPLGRDKTSGFARQKETERLTVDEVIHGVMPDGKTNPDGWITRMRARMAPRIKRRTGLADRDRNLNVLLKEIMDELEEIDEIGNIKMAVGIMRRRTKLYVKQRAAHIADKQRQADERAEIYEYGRSLRMKDVHITGVIAKIPPGIDYPKRCHGALDAYRRDNPEPADGPQPGIYETGFVPDIAGATKIMEAYEASQRTAPPVAPVPGEPVASELDEVFGKREKRPIVNPGNWTHDGPKLRKFYADLSDKGWNKYGIPGPDKSKHIHTALDVTSLHETNLSPDVALVAILVYLEKLFATKESDVALTKLTAEDWVAWLKEHGWKSADVLSILNEHCLSNGEAPVTKFSEWPSDLDEAQMAVEAALKKNAAKQASTSQSQATTADDSVQSKTVPQNPINSGIQSNGGKVPSNIIKLDESQIRAKYTKKMQGGKEYLEVAGRVLLFRLDHPAESGWTIDTELVHADEKGCIFKARVANPDGHIVATGHARATEATSKNFSGRIFEKAETAAIGRALAHAGYGTDDVEETDESESPSHLADSPRKSA